MDGVKTLTVDVRPGERLEIAAGRPISVEMVHKSGKLARLRIRAPVDVRIEKTMAPFVPSMAE